jgi:HEAT repeat protein
MKPRFIIIAACSLLLQTFTAPAAIEQTVDDLIPKLAAEQFEERYRPQMELLALAANASRPGAETERAELARVLVAKATDASVPQPARVWIVRQLENIGAAESVAGLTSLLKNDDAELRECARRALEKNSAPTASASLRAALEQGGPSPWQVGLIQSLGERADAASVDLIASKLSQPDLALAAASALGKIASDAAVKQLWSACEKKSADAADALIVAANRLAAGSNERKAKAIFARLYADSTAPQLRAAALDGLARTDPAAAGKLVPEALAQTDPKLQDAALLAARKVHGKKVSDVLAGLLPRLSAPAKCRALGALDASAEKQLVAAAEAPEEPVRVAALERIGQVGGAASVPLLIRTASQMSGDTRKAAVSALATIPGRGADTAIRRAGAQGDAKTRAAAIGALADRGDRAALADLLKYAAESDTTVAGAACAAIGRMGADSELEPLLALAGKAPGADAAVQSVASRAGDKSAAAKKVVARLNNANAQETAMLLELLTALGGEEGLAAVSSRVKSDREETRDAAVRALANWPEFAAVPQLLAIAKDPNGSRVHNVLATQGVARLVKTSDKEAAQARVDAAVAGMEAAKRDEEKKLLISSLASVPSPASAEALKSCLKDAKFQAEASLAGVTLAQSLMRGNRAAAKDLAQAVLDTNPSDEIKRRAEGILRR